MVNYDNIVSDPKYCNIICIISFTEQFLTWNMIIRDNHQYWVFISKIKDRTNMIYYNLYVE